MPHMLSDTDQGRAEAVHLAAFLLSNENGQSTESDADAGEVDDALVERGLELYETRGCMACHRFTPPTGGDEYDRISLYFAAEKFRPNQLAKFLRKPHENYHAVRMPDFGFDDDESFAVAAYVRSQSTGKLERLAEVEPDRGLGQKLFVERQCNQCHELGEAQLAAAPYGTLFQAANRRGCLAESDALRGSAPDFGFDEAVRGGLLRFLQGTDAPLRVQVKGEVATRTMERLRCLACHDHDATYSSLPDITADEGELGLPYERIPNLGSAGEKLQSDWLRRQILGTLDYRSRPWLKMKMPAFPHYADRLAVGLAAEHGVVMDGVVVDGVVVDGVVVDGVAMDELFANESTDELISAGKELSTKEKGFDCLQCHSLGDDFIELENKANGVGLSYITDRLRKDYYHRWIRDPLRIDPLTKMPKFTTDGVKSQRTEYFDGDAQQQFEALWHYMRQLGSSRKPSTPTTSER